jgi:small subunit ribosomal protein S3
MGQKVHPRGYRLGVTTAHKSRWYADSAKKGQSYADFINEDIAIRRFINKNYVRAGIAKIEIERKGKDVVVDVFAGRSGLIIGKAGAGIEGMRSSLAKNLKKKESEIRINVIGMDNPQANAQLVAQRVAEDLVNRVTFRRAMKKAIEGVQAAGFGVKIMCSGRLGGAEMARNEFYREGSVPLHTLRAFIDYGFFEAHTTYGRIGVKVWIYKGEITEHEYDLRQLHANKKNRQNRPNRPAGAPGAPAGVGPANAASNANAEAVAEAVEAAVDASAQTPDAAVDVTPVTPDATTADTTKEGDK